ncbi:hypothetical protein HELRODRAFT_178157 [Helobdella robusta]|uniref:Ig-like domain-containing protein n=1 Tax=Helobdella robusta TaxID=6412 RepID=T1FCU7_HELRO|nr:hypothetical protein HELRODRAFT_178157 [Helobdella robusta]ESN97368.1 hypothetical protein HELRODRAFT_178157 [Helobdella robusta]
MAGMSTQVQYTRLDVLYAPRISCFDVSATVNDLNVTLRCNVTSKPRPDSFDWFKKSTNETLSDKHELGNGLLESWLMLEHLGVESFMTYELVVRNEVGHTAASVKLMQKSSAPVHYNQVYSDSLPYNILTNDDDVDKRLKSNLINYNYFKDETNANNTDKTSNNVTLAFHKKAIKAKKRNKTKNGSQEGNSSKIVQYDFVSSNNNRTITENKKSNRNIVSNMKAALHQLKHDSQDRRPQLPAPNRQRHYHKYAWSSSPDIRRHHARNKYCLHSLFMLLLFIVAYFYCRF